MAKLGADLHVAFNVDILSLLRNARIITVADFVRADGNALCAIIQKDLIAISNIKRDLLRRIGPALNTGRQRYQILQKQSQPFLTGITCLDELLDGGILSGNIIDLCGLSGTGKSLLCRAIAINLAINYGLETLFIDTKGDFSATAIHKALSQKYTSETHIKHIMRRIKATKCRDPNELIQIVQSIIDSIGNNPKYKLLVIDSLPAIWFNMYGMNTSYAQRTLSLLIHRLRQLAVEHAIIIVAVNVVTTNVPYGSNTEADASVNKFIPALGKCWQSMCSLRLILVNDTTTQATPTDKMRRIIRIIKSNQLKTDNHCAVNLNDIIACSQK